MHALIGQTHVLSKCKTYWKLVLLFCAWKIYIVYDEANEEAETMCYIVTKHSGHLRNDSYI